MTELFIRLSVFGLSVALLPYRVVPWSVRVGFICVLCFFFFSFGKSGGETSAHFASYLVHPEAHLFSPISMSAALSQGFVGLTLGVAVSVGMYAAMLTGAFLKSLLYAQSEKHFGFSGGPEINILSSLESLFLIATFYLLLTAEHFQALFVLLGSSIAEGLGSALPGSGASTASVGMIQVVSNVGIVALQTALVALLPVVFAVLCVVVVSVLFHRIVQQVLERELLHSALFPVVIVVLSLSFYFLFDQLESASSNAVSAATLEKSFPPARSK